MPDFGRLIAQGKTQRSARPRDIFNRLVKPPHILDLLPGQVEVLNRWWDLRDQRDNIIKQNTGSGKTLVGILIAESTMAEKNGRVLYLCPNNQLVSQTIEKAAEVGINAERYQAGEPLPARFLSGDVFLVASYAALFNGKSRFGVSGRPESVSVQAIILDDAHVELSSLRNAFSLTVRGDVEDTKNLYSRLVAILRPAFENSGRLGTFDDIVEGKEYAVVEVPYWKWDKTLQIQVASVVKEQDDIAWPLLRNDFENCHILVGRKAVSIVPILPPVDLLPTFADASRRIYMSATLADDSVLAATFGLPKSVIDRAITTQSITSVGERMILVPGFRPDLNVEAVRKRVKILANEVTSSDYGVLILVPSGNSSQEWAKIATIMDTPEKVETAVRSMQNGENMGPFVFANRYDGIDLRGNACRLLVMDGKPQGRSEYETYRASAVVDSSEIASTMAQRIEQGLGRGSRGAGDYCAVIVLGDDLVEWISQRDNWKFMTATTRAQIGIGETTSETLENLDDLVASVWQLINRDAQWVEFHQRNLADRIDAEEPAPQNEPLMLLERQAYEHARIGEYAEASLLLEKPAQSEASTPRGYKAWFLQMAARYAWFSGDKTRAISLQRNAYMMNRGLFKPPIDENLYIPAVGPEFDQVQEVLKRADCYTRSGGYVAKVTSTLLSLTNPRSTSNVFEEALRELGDVLGFTSERPDNGCRPRKGPDVLWLASNREAFVIEAKNEKNNTSYLSKEDHAQLLQACEWFLTNYQGYTHDRLVVLPEAKVTESVDLGITRALARNDLNSLVDDVIAGIREIALLPRTAANRPIRAREILEKYRLTPAFLRTRFCKFEVDNGNVI